MPASSELAWCTSTVAPMPSRSRCRTMAASEGLSSMSRMRSGMRTASHRRHRYATEAPLGERSSGCERRISVPRWTRGAEASRGLQAPDVGLQVAAWGRVGPAASEASSLLQRLRHPGRPCMPKPGARSLAPRPADIWRRTSPALLRAWGRPRSPGGRRRRGARRRRGRARRGTRRPSRPGRWSALPPGRGPRRRSPARRGA